MYTAGVVGQKSKEKFAVDSLKVAELSIWMGQEVTHEPPAPEFLIIDENTSTLDRFNEEKNWIELMLSQSLLPDGEKATHYTTLRASLLKAFTVSGHINSWKCYRGRYRRFQT